MNMLDKYQAFINYAQYTIRHYDKEIIVFGDPKQADQIVVQGSLESGYLFALYKLNDKLVGVASYKR